jgi:hypothetical protein
MAAIVGTRPSNTVIGITTGLGDRLSRDELGPRRRSGSSSPRTCSERLVRELLLDERIDHLCELAGQPARR